jgi:rRNA maturation endonuclease Nob1
MISCGGCGRRFATDDGPGMIALIKGPCPDCGGRFGLLDD